MKPYYQDDKYGITIYHGDCRELLDSILYEDYLQLLIVDPPYGISHSSAGGPTKGSIGAASWANTEIPGDRDTNLRDWILAIRKENAVAMFGSPKVPRPDGIRATLIWDKGAMTGMGDISFPWKPSFEEIYIIGDGWTGRRDEAVLKGHFVVTWESRGRTHPHEKPISLMKHLICKHPGSNVIDPCCGTGAALIAASSLGRCAIGIEIEEKYCEIAAKRLSQEVLQF